MPVFVNPKPPGAQASKSVDILTPPTLLAALGALRETDDGWELGRDPFDLDPCASYRPPWPTARTMLTKYEDGTAHPWEGEVWLNPPYGKDLYLWLARLAAHGNGMALLYARTDTQGFHSQVWERADAVYFFAGRLVFHAPVTGRIMRDRRGSIKNCGGPMVLAVYGKRSVERAGRLLESEYPGRLVPVTHTKRGKR